MRWIEATTLGDLLDRRASVTPGNDAVVFPEERVTYGELAARADEVASGLLSLGVRRGDRVGYFLPDGVDAAAVLFGIAKAGAIVVPINARFKAFELETVIRHSGMSVLFTTPSFGSNPDLCGLVLDSFPEIAAGSTGPLSLASLPELRHVVSLGPTAPSGVMSRDRFDDAAASFDAAMRRVRQDGVKVRDTAVIMYTSGTTSAPKGAMLSHEAFSRQSAATVHDRMSLTDEDRIWTALPLFHIGGVAFLVAAIYAGAAYCHTGHFAPDRAVAQLVEERCTVALPGFETIWLPVLNSPALASADVSALRIVMCSGVVERLHQMQAALPGARIVTPFGQTECCAFLSLTMPDDPDDVRLETGGLPYPGMEARIADLETGELSEHGRGEICYRGPNAFDGYFRDETLTAFAFDADGWFHTGDIGTIDKAGRITFVSRLKDMLKVGGENVAAAEVEGYLLGHPAVLMAQVVAAPDAYYREVPAAYLQLKPGATATEQGIIDFCLGRIATFRVPRYVRFVEEWPMSGTKVKKYELRERITAELEAAGITEAPKLRTR
jgi:fatty-acyl-CoA synthase